MHLVLQSLKEGDVVELVGFDSLDAGTLRMINSTPSGQLFFFCRDGQYFIQNLIDYDPFLTYHSVKIVTSL